MNSYKGILDLVYPMIENHIDKLLINFKRDLIYEGISKGQIDLENIEFNCENLNLILFYNIPIKIFSGKLKKLHLSLPMITNIMKESVIFEIENLIIDLEFTDLDDLKIIENEISHKIKLHLLENFKNNILDKIDSKNKFTDSFMMGIIWKILENLKFVIKNIKINLNTNKLKIIKPNAFMFMIEKIEYYSTDKNYNYFVIDRSKYNENNFYKFILFEKITLSDIKGDLIEPFKFELKIKKNEKINSINKFNYEILIDFPDIKINFSKRNFNHTVLILNHFTDCKIKINEIKNNFKILETPNIKDLKKEFLNLFSVYINKNLNENQENRIKFIVNVTDIKILYSWMKFFIEKDYLDIKKSKETKSGFFSFYKVEEKEIKLTEEDKNKIDECIKYSIDHKNENKISKFQHLKNIYLDIKFKKVNLNLHQYNRDFVFNFQNLETYMDFYTLNKYDYKFSLNNLEIFLLQNSREYNLIKTDSEELMNFKISCNNISFVVYFKIFNFNFNYHHDAFFFLSDFLSISSKFNYVKELDYVTYEYNKILSFCKIYDIKFNFNLDLLKIIIPYSIDNLIVNFENIKINNNSENIQNCKIMNFLIKNLNIYTDNLSINILEKFTINNEIIFHYNVSQKNIYTIEINNSTTSLKFNLCKELILMIDESIKIYSNYFKENKIAKSLELNNHIAENNICNKNEFVNLNLVINSKINFIEVSLFCEEGKILEFIIFETNNKIIYSTEKIENVFSLQEIEIKNHLTNFNILTTHPFNINNEPFLIFEISLVDENSNLLKNQKSNVSLVMTEINFIYEPIVINKLIKFIFQIENAFNVNNQVSNDNSPFIKNEKFINSPLKLNRDLNLNFILNKLNVSLIHDKTQCLIYEFSTKNIKLNFEEFEDNFIIKIDFGSINLFDLSNYPNTIINQNDFNSENKKYLLKIENDIKMKINKTEKRSQFKSLLNIELELLDLQINFIHQPIRRFIEFLLKRLNDFKKYLKSDFNNFIHPDEIFNLDLNIKNPKIIMKPREYFEQYFMFDFGKIKINNVYDFENKLILILNCKEMILINKDLKNKKEFLIIPQTNLDLTAAIPKENNFTEIQMNLDYVNFNIRQEDLNLFLKCLDLNILYKDNKKEMKLFEKNNYNIEDFSNSRIINYLEYNIKNEKVNLTVTNSKFNINILDKFEKIISNLTCKNLIFSYLFINNPQVKTKNIKFTLKSIEIFIYEEEKKVKEEVLSYYTENYDLLAMENKNEINFNIELNLLTRKIKMNLNLNNIKLVFKYFYFILISTFITESFPKYDDNDFFNTQTKIKKYFIKKEKEFNEFHYEINLNDPLITFDTSQNSTLELIGIKMKEIKIIGKLKQYQNYYNNLKEIQNLIRENSDLVNDLNQYREDYSETFVAFNKMEIFIDNLSNKIFILNRDESLMTLKINISLLLDSKNEICEFLSANVNVETIELKVSYKDFLTFIKAVNLNLSSVKTINFIEKISNLQMKSLQEENNKNQFIREDNNIFDNFSIEFNGKKTEVTLINDNSNVYYPFLSGSLNDFHLFLYNNKENFQQMKLDAHFLFEISSFNYIAGKWEPIIEEIPILLNYSKEKNFQEKNLIFDKDLITINITDKVSGIMNFNISDMNVAFLCTSLKSWIDKLIEEKNKYENNQILNINENSLLKNEKIKISNHTINNLSGRNIIIKGNRNNNFKHLLQIDEIYDIEYFGKENNILEFYLEENDSNTQNINIDQIEIKYHKMNFNERISDLIPKSFDFLISEVNCENTKRIVTIYSPLIFYNKTDFTLIILLYNLNPEDVYIIILNPKQRSAVPNQYLNSRIEIQNSVNETRSEIIELINICNSPKEFFKMIKIENSFFNLYRNLDKSLNNVREIKITNSYIIKNGLPFDVEIYLPLVNQIYNIKKSDKIQIDKLSLNDNLFCVIKFDHYKTKDPICLYDVNNKTEEKIRLIKIEDIFQSNVFIAISCVILKDIKNSHREILLYSSNIFVNKTGLYNLRLFYDKKREMIPDKETENSNIFIYNNDSNEDNKFFLDIYSAQSSYVKVEEVQSNSNVKVQIKDKNMFYEFVIQNSLSNLPNLSLKNEIYSNIFTINPSVIIHNKINFYKLCISLKEDIYQYDIIDSNSSLPFYFFAKKTNSEICLKPNLFDEFMNEIGIKYEWSQPINLSNLGLFTIPVFIEKSSNDQMLIDINSVYGMSENGYDRIYLNFEIKEENLIKHVIIYEADEVNSQFVIENNLSLNDYKNIKIYQEGYEQINSTYMNNEKSVIYSLFNYSSNQEKYANNIINFEIQKSDNFIIKLKYSIFEDQVKNDLNNFQSEYPFEEEIDENLKIVFISNGLKKTIKFENNFYNNKETQVRCVKMFNLELLIDRLGISIISDNKYKDTKLRNYERNEILYIMIKSIMVSYLIESKNSLKESEDSQFNLAISDFQIDNQVSKFAKFPNMVKIISNDFNMFPFFRLSVFSEIHKSDKVSKIKFLNYDMRPIKIGLDADLLDHIISFIKNIFYQLNSNYIVINEIFSNNKSKIKNQTNIQISNYKYFAQNLETSDINLVISISEKGFKDFLSKHLNLGSFIISIINNLTILDDIEIKLNGEKIKYYYGEFENIIMRLLTHYKQELISKIFGIGAKGLLLGIIKIFSTQATIPVIPINMRMRLPRALYGKYKIVKNYNKFHSEVIDLINRNIIKIYGDLILDFYNCEIFKGEDLDILLLFTTKNIIFINGTTLYPYYIIDYFTIEEVEIKNNKIIVQFNQIIDGVILNNLLINIGK